MENSQMKLRKFAPHLKESKRIIRKSKIRLVSGSNLCAVHQPYEIWYGYQIRMQSGMEVFRTLKAATNVTAGSLRMGHLIVTLEPSKLVDITGWHRDRLDNRDALSECNFVMKDDNIYRVSDIIVDEHSR